MSDQLASGRRFRVLNLGARGPFLIEAQGQTTWVCVTQALFCKISRAGLP